MWGEDITTSLVVVSVGGGVLVGLGLGVGGTVGVGDGGRHVGGGRPNIRYIDTDWIPVCGYPGQTCSKTCK